MVHYIPHTENEIASMLEEIGCRSIKELFADIPGDLLLESPLGLPEGLPENDVYDRLYSLSCRNNTGFTSFLGCGSYDHIIPSAVKHLSSRSEFLTAYTPYQAEISQGILQGMFEFQTMMCEITGLDVSNASLYDGHTAVCEAAGLALASVRKSDTILYSACLNPNTKQVLKTHFSGTDVRLVEIAEKQGITDYEDLAEKIGPGTACMIIQSPNCYGYLEDMTNPVSLAAGSGALAIMAANPLSFGLLKAPGEWGADVAVGDIQPFGIPSCYGGPSAGYITAKMKYLHKMPGRIAGESIDTEGRRAYILTLQSREQHIKREKAGSNICSNQNLCALTAAIFLSALGRQGFRELALRNLQKAHYLHDLILASNRTGTRDVISYSGRQFFNEFSLLLPVKASLVIERLMEENILAGVELHNLDPGFPENLLTLAVTEKRTKEELDRCAAALKKAVS